MKVMNILLVIAPLIHITFYVNAMENKKEEDKHLVKHTKRNSYLSMFTTPVSTIYSAITQVDIYKGKEDLNSLDKTVRGVNNWWGGDLYYQKIGITDSKRMGEQSYKEASESEWEKTKSLYGEVNNNKLDTLSQDSLNAIADRTKKVTEFTLNYLPNCEHDNETPLKALKQLLKNYPSMPWWVLLANIKESWKKEQQLLSQVSKVAKSSLIQSSSIPDQKKSLLDVILLKAMELTQLLDSLDSQDIFQLAEEDDEDKKNKEDGGN